MPLVCALVIPDLVSLGHSSHPNQVRGRASSSIPHHQGPFSHAHGEECGHLGCVWRVSSTIRIRENTLNSVSSEGAMPSFPGPTKCGAPWCSPLIPSLMAPLALWGDMGHRLQQRPHLQEDYGPQKQLGPRCHHWSRWYHRPSSGGHMDAFLPA